MQVTQVDLVQTQIRIAAGATLKDLGLVQKNVKVGGVAMQCRVTTEDPSQVRSVPCTVNRSFYCKPSRVNRSDS